MRVSVFVFFAEIDHTIIISRDEPKDDDKPERIKIYKSTRNGVHYLRLGLRVR